MSPRSILAAVLLVAVAPAPILANGPGRLRVFAAANWVAPLDDSAGLLDGELATLEVGASSGWEVGLEWRFNPRLGLEASIAQVDLDVDFASSRLGTVVFEPIYVALNVHLHDGEAFDWWVAPTLMLLEWDEAEFDRGVELGESSDEIVGATVGVDVRWNEAWAFTAAVRYFDAQLRFAGGGEAAVDPLVLRAGISWRP